MPIVRDEHNIGRFFDAIEYKMDGYQIRSFSYLAVKNKDEFYIHKGRLFLNTGPTRGPITQFRSEHVRAGVYTTSELKLEPRQLVNSLVEGSLCTPDGELHFDPNEGANFLAVYDPLHPDGQATQLRYDALTILGGRQRAPQPMLDWELKASPTPYDNLQELAFDYAVGALPETATVEVVAFNVAGVDPNSTILGTSGKLGVRLASGLMSEDVTLGYRVFSSGRVVKRAVISGREMQWTQQTDYQSGEVEIEVPPATVLHCIASYHGVAQNYFWIVDPTTVQNAKRVVYELADNQLEILNDMLTKAASKGIAARELETGVAWLLWMMGFSVAHLGSTPRTQDAVDLIATTPAGNFAVVECTTGLLKADQKLPRVVERAETIRRRLIESGNRHLRVLAVIVTSKTRAEVSADIEQAERLKVLVITREDLEQSTTRTLAPPNADQIFRQGEEAVEAAAAKYNAQLPLPAVLE